MARQKISIWRKTPQMILSVLWVTTLTLPLGCSPREDLADKDFKVLNYFRSWRCSNQGYTLAEN